MDPDPLPYLADISAATSTEAFISFHSPIGMSWVAWTILIVIALCCLGISAFVSGSEIAYFGLTQSDVDKLEEDAEEDSHSKKAFELISHSEQFLATILIANNLVNITMVVLLSFAINAVITFNSAIANFLLQTVFLTFLLLLCGEIFPKLVANERMVAWSRTAAGPLTLIYRLVSPIARLMVKSTTIVNRVVTKKHENISADELSQALNMSDVKAGKDKEMLEGILTFGEKEVHDIMISRVDVTDIEYHDDWNSVLATIRDSGYSRIPVYDTTQDSIKGILYSKDLLPYMQRADDTFRWQNLIRPAYFVPESRMIDDLLEDFRKKKIHIAVVVDEYGGTQGIVTLEDIIEEIVGDIDDEYDEDKKFYRRLDMNTYIFEGKTPLADFCRITGIEEETDLNGDFEDMETLAGLLLTLKGDFPQEKETFVFGRLRFLVMGVERHRITRVRVHVMPTIDIHSDKQQDKQQ